MKKIYSILLTVVALLSLSSIAKAQEPPYILIEEGDAKGLAYSKKISPPSDGKYIITLESFVTGEKSVQKLSVPSAIVLVLDCSGSMVDTMGSDYFERPSMTYSYNDCDRFQPYSGSNYQVYYYKHTDGKYYEVLQDDSGNYFTTYYQLYYTVNGRKYYLSGNSVTTTRPENVTDPNATIFTGVLYDGNTRMGALHDAVKAFIGIIDENDTENQPDGERLGNQISIVSFASSSSVEKDLTPLSGNGKNELIEAVYRLKPYGGTQTADGMEEAETILTDAKFQLKTTVLFTDGIPGKNGNWSNGESWTVANNTIACGDRIKKLAVESDDAKKRVLSNVFTVGIFSTTNPDKRTQVYMKATSSDYKGATGMGTQWSWDDGDIWSNVEGDETMEKVHENDTYTFTADDKNKLKEAFEKIADISGGSSLELDGNTTSTVDIVSKSFKLPNGGKVEDIKVYTWDCYDLEKDFAYEDEGVMKKGDFLKFKNKQLTSLVPTLEKSDPNSEKFDVIKVNGFNYSDNWCGFDQTQNKYRGKKLSIEIPVMMDDDAVGGPDISTNAPGSGIYIKGKDTPFVEFKSPVVSLPINMHIRKEGLNIGESSKFTIQRKLKSEPDTAYGDVTSVFVTRHSGQEEDGKNAPVVKVVGLPSVTKIEGKTAEYVYRIIEDDWSWSYNLKKIYGYNYDPDTDTTTEKDLTESGAISTAINRNPFIFKNSKTITEPKVRHAESKVTNTFEEGKGASYVDSKTNER